MERERALLVAFGLLVLLFLLFGGAVGTGAMMTGGYMGHGAMMGGVGWIWVPTLLVLFSGIFLGWAIFGQRGG